MAGCKVCYEFLTGFSLTIFEQFYSTEYPSVCGGKFCLEKFSEANRNSVEDCVLHQEKKSGPALSKNNNNLATIYQN